MDNDSHQLFDDPNDHIPIRPSDESIERRFRQFHQQNPCVYQLLVQLAREAKRQGRSRIGVKMLWEVVRWNLSKDLPNDQVYKLPNDYHSRYARLIMAQEKDLDKIFEVRPLRSS